MEFMYNPYGKDEQEYACVEKNKLLNCIIIFYTEKLRASLAVNLFLKLNE